MYVSNLITSKESLTIPHEHREYMVFDERPRNQIREEDQHSFQGIVQGLEYGLAKSAGRLSHVGAGYEGILSCWRGSIFITWAEWRVLGDERGSYAKGSRGVLLICFRHHSRTTALCGATI